MNFHNLIMLFAGLETLKGNPVRENSLEFVFIPVIDNLSRLSRDLAHWNRVTNKLKQYEYVNEPEFKMAHHFYSGDGMKQFRK